MRLFLGIKIGDDLRTVFSALQEELRPKYRGFRFIEPANLHMTLKFLGEVSDAAVSGVEEIGASLATTNSGGELVFDRLHAFPSWRRPNVLAVGCSTVPPASLAAIYDALNGAFAEMGIAAEKRGFSPHVTLARNKNRPPRSVEPDLRALEPATLAVGVLTLFQSRTTPQGAVYTARREWRLSG